MPIKMLKGDKINVFYFIEKKKKGNFLIFEKKMKKKIYADDPEIHDLTTPGVQSLFLIKFIKFIKKKEFEVKKKSINSVQ